MDIPPVQLQTPEEGCSKKRQQDKEDELIDVLEVYLHPDDYDEEEDQKRHDKLMAELWKKNKKHIDAAIASYRKPNCETNIDRPVATTDVGPGDEPKKIRGKKNRRVSRKGKMSGY